MRLEHPEVTAKSLRDHFESRRNHMEILDRELNTHGQVLLSLLPESLKIFKGKAFHDMKQWLTYLESNTRQGVCNSIKITNPSNYGFKDGQEALERMEELKSAWAGIIEVEITNNDCVEVRFKIVR